MDLGGSSTGMPEVDEQMEGLIRWWSRPANCDVAGRHTLQRLTRLWEERRTIDGDVFVLKLSDGRVQSIESAAGCPSAAAGVGVGRAGDADVDDVGRPAGAAGG